MSAFMIFKPFNFSRTRSLTITSKALKYVGMDIKRFFHFGKPLCSLAALTESRHTELLFSKRKDLTLVVRHLQCVTLGYGCEIPKQTPVQIQNCGISTNHSCLPKKTFAKYYNRYHLHWRPYQRKNLTITRSKLNSEIKYELNNTNYYSDWDGSSNNTRHGFTPFGVAFSIITFAALESEKEEEDKELAIRRKIAGAFIAEKNGDIGKAERLFHAALHKAQKDDNKKAILYIYNHMANLCFNHNKHWKAENLFREFMKLLFSMGIADDDPAVIEASLKLAQICEAQFRYTEAKVGYLWCISQAEKRLQSMKESGESPERLQNVQALLGVCLGTTGHFMMGMNKLEEAERMYTRAIGLCEKELVQDGKPHPQASILLNDLGSVYDLQKNYDKAFNCIQRAINLSQNAPEDLPVMMCNLASVELHRGNHKEAAQLYVKALHIAKKNGDQDTISKIQVAMAKMEATASNK